MPNLEERERYFEKVINRWENEGGALAKSAHHRVEMADGKADDQSTVQKLAARRDINEPD